MRLCEAGHARLCRQNKIRASKLAPTNLDAHAHGQPESNRAQDQHRFLETRISRQPTSMTHSNVFVAMMQVGKMRMLMSHRRVMVPVRMRFCHRPIVRVLMVFVVNVVMFVV